MSIPDNPRRYPIVSPPSMRIDGCTLASTLALTAWGVTKVPGAISDFGSWIKDQHDSFAYTIKTEVIKEIPSEKIERYSELEKMKRIAGFITNSEKSCAEVLNTCHLDAKSNFHRKRLLEQLTAWHPDQIEMHPNPLIREGSNIALDASYVLINILGKLRKERGCYGQDQQGCLNNRKVVEKVKTFIIPSELYKVLLNMQPTCQLTEEGVTKTLDLEQCSNLDDTSLTL